MTYCYIEFQKVDENLLTRLTDFLSLVVRERALPHGVTSKNWYQFLSEEERRSFWWPNESQIGDAKARWGEVPLIVVSEPENDQSDWDLYSLFAVLRKLDVEYHGIEFMDEGPARLSFVSADENVSGVEAIERVIELFGHKLIAMDIGEGRESLNETEDQDEVSAVGGAKDLQAS